MFRYLWLFVLSTLAVLLLMSTPAAAQITTNTAFPVNEGRGIVRAQSKVLRSTGSGPMNREVTAYAFPVVGVYSIDPNWAAFGVFPILDKNLDATIPQGPRQGEQIERGRPASGTRASSSATPCGPAAGPDRRSALRP